MDKKQWLKRHWWKFIAIAHTIIMSRSAINAVPIYHPTDAPLRIGGALLTAFGIWWVIQKVLSKLVSGSKDEEDSKEF